MILITGATGQLGRELVRLATARAEAFTAVSRPAFDLASPDSIAAAFHACAPALVINAAAYTAVDAAESDIAAARAGNHTGPAHLAALCHAADIPLIHVSTDYVFDGNKGAPYVETDPTNPTGIYGQTKQDGETAILGSGARTIILRTAWVYAGHGKNFARTMLTVGAKMPALRVVADQRGTPTAAGDLAAAIFAIIDTLRRTGWQAQYQGIFHATNAGETTWFGFAQEIFAQAALFGGPAPALTPISTAEWPTPARRPADSRLDGTKLGQIFAVTLPPWQASLPPIVASLMTL
ncbi:MAG: dTDP-4-dehydrorhamnose reductase [Acidocella sp.]|nr:dTDP-4-dehydrorhamnose reductase [Acidocella sp.]